MFFLITMVTWIYKKLAPTISKTRNQSSINSDADFADFAAIFSITVCNTDFFLLLLLLRSIAMIM